jgi:delta1-piperideine-2-carboxylate reductase
MIIGLSPKVVAGDGWQDHVEGFMQKMTAIDGVHMPGARRHKNRLNKGPRQINTALIETINSLL